MIQFIMRDVVFFADQIAHHLTLAELIRATVAIGIRITPRMVTETMISRSFRQMLQTSLGALNASFSPDPAMRFVQIDRVLRRTFAEFTALVNGAGVAFHAVEVTVNHMRTHDQVGMPYPNGSMLNPVTPMSGGYGVSVLAVMRGQYFPTAPGILMTHMRRQITLRLRVVDGVMVGENVDGHANGLDLMVGNLPHAFNEHGHHDVVWVE